MTQNFTRTQRLGIALTLFSQLLSRYSVFALGLLLGACLFFPPIQSSLKTTEKKYQDAYGQALADSAARESVEAVFRNDLVSLRAIVQATATNPFVVRVSMQSVEQETLVQAGPLLHELPQQARSFESTITLHDSIAGAVTVTIDPGPNSGSTYSHLFRLLVLVTALIIIWQAWSLDVLRNRVRDTIQNILNSKTIENNTDISPLEIPPQETDSQASNLKDPKTDNDASKEQGSAYLALCVKNVSVLQHQLNGETFRHTFTQLEKRLQQVGNLYGLQACRWQEDRYLLSFSTSDSASALFNAACAGRLMLDLAGIINRVPLDLSAEVSLHEAPLIDAHMPFVGLAVNHQNNAQSLLSDRVEYLNISEDDQRKLIFSFSAPYAELLKKQMAKFQPKPQFN